MEIKKNEDDYSLVRKVEHTFINDLLGFNAEQYKSIHLPHEWWFIKLLMNEIKRKNELADAFMMFAFQYYPNYKWSILAYNDIAHANYLSAIVLESFYRDYELKMHYTEYASTNDDITDAINFGEIATDFLIRYCNYSLVDFCNQKTILTALDNCGKRFEKELLDGYSLYRVAKISYHRIPEDLQELYPQVRGIFYKLPVLPTKDSWLSIEEIIETSDGSYQYVIRPINLLL